MCGIERSLRKAIEKNPDTWIKCNLEGIDGRIVGRVFEDLGIGISTLIQALYDDNVQQIDSISTTYGRGLGAGWVEKDWDSEDIAMYVRQFPDNVNLDVTPSAQEPFNQDKLTAKGVNFYDY